jgi:hypothetical protein
MASRDEFSASLSQNLAHLCRYALAFSVARDVTAVAPRIGAAGMRSDRRRQVVKASAATWPPT